MQIQIQGNLGFSRYATPLHVAIVIFRKKFIIRSESWRKSNFQAWTLRIVHYTSLFSS